jgi:hypothetical protein
MGEQSSGRQGQGQGSALIYHRKRLIGKGFVDWTRGSPVARAVGHGGLHVCRWEARSYPFGMYCLSVSMPLGADPGPSTRAKNLANQWLMVIAYHVLGGQETAYIVSWKKEEA